RGAARRTLEPSTLWPPPAGKTAPPGEAAGPELRQTPNPGSSASRGSVRAGVESSRRASRLHRGGQGAGVEPVLHLVGGQLRLDPAELVLDLDLHGPVHRDLAGPRHERELVAGPLGPEPG